MGTHACTRIQSNNDYIEAHTRWDGFPQEIKEDLKNIYKSWELTINTIKEKINSKNYNSIYINKWLLDMESLIKETKETQEISRLMGLLCAKSFNHHQVLFSNQPKGDDTLEYYGKGNPDVLYSTEKNKFSKSLKIKEAKENELLIDDNHFLLRIIDVNNAENGLSAINYSDVLSTNIYVDGMTKNEVDKLITELPLFWLEMHSLLRLTKQEHINNYNNHGRLSRNIFSEYILEKFYSPTDEYKRFEDDKYQDKELLLDNISAMIPFDFSSNAFANHLFLASAGKIRNITEGQNKIYSKDKTLNNIYIIPSENRTNMFGYKVDSSEEIKDSFINRLKNIVSEIKSDLYPEVMFYKIPKDNLFAYNYENTVLDVMSVLSAKPTENDLKLLNKTKENIKKNKFNW